jgi:hypothetical protein
MVQLDSFQEIPSEKRPPDDIIWDGTPEEMDDWFDKVFNRKNKQRPDEIILNISEGDIG